MSRRRKRQPQRPKPGPELQWAENLGDAFLRQTVQLIGATVRALVAVVGWGLSRLWSRGGRPEQRPPKRPAER
jgi:hypothetical protein